MPKPEQNKKRKKQKKHTAAPAAEAEQPVSVAQPASNLHPRRRNFETWLDDAGVEWRDCCRLDEADAGMGQGVFAARDIAPGEVVLSVPDDAVLMPDDCCIAQELQTADLGHGGRGGGHGESVALVLALMAEKCAGKASRWRGYIDALPQAALGLLCWPEDNRAALAGTAAADKLAGVGTSGEALPTWGPAIELPTQVEEAYDSVVQPFVRRHKQRFKAPQGMGGSRGVYQWATSVVAGYSFELGDDRFQAMVPLWDALNHITGRCNVRLHHDEDAECLQMIATEAIAAGDELVNNYGELGNADLLRRFGFVELDNPHDCAQVPWTTVYDAAARIVLEAAPAEALRRALQPPEKEQRQRWKRLAKTKVAPSDGWFRISRAGEPQPQAARAAAAALADLRSRLAEQHDASGSTPAASAPGNIRDGSPAEAHPEGSAAAADGSAAEHAGSGGCDAGCCHGVRARSGAGSGRKRKRKRRKEGAPAVAGPGAAAAANADAQPPTVADVLRVLRKLVPHALRCPEADGATAAAEQLLQGRSLEWALAQEQSSEFFQAAAAMVVRKGEQFCWRAFTTDWLAAPDVEQQVAVMLLAA